MDSGTVLSQPPPTSYDSSENQGLTPSLAVMDNGLSPTPPADFSSTNPAIQVDPTSPDPTPQSTAASPPSDHAIGFSGSASDRDAEGSFDTDFGGDSQVDEQDHISRPSTSGSDDSRRSAKRKADVDEDEYIKQNPELYGLRRSHRAVTTQKLVQSDSAEDSDSDIDTRPALKRRKPNHSQRTSKAQSPAVRLATPRDSDSDTYGGIKARDQVRKQRRKQLRDAASGLAPPLPNEFRFTSRRAAKVTSYNEEEDDFEEDDDEGPGYYYAAADTGPAIGEVLNHRRKDDTDAKDDPGFHDFQYLIKWQGKAHYHATWEEWVDLSNLSGFKRLTNYFKKLRQDLDIAQDPNITPEQKEQWNLDREKKLDELQDYTQVERVINSRDVDADTEYLVKWKGLFYDSCTWEAASLVLSIARAEISRYLERSTNIPVSNKIQSNFRTREKHWPIREQPDYIQHGTLRNFQLTGLNFLAHNWTKGENAILADEMGLGKTIQTISFMNWLRHDRGQQGPFIVIVPLSTMPGWSDTFNNWTPDLNYVVYNGNQEARAIIRENEFFVDGDVRKTKFHALLTTYEYILADHGDLSQIKWQFMAVDEAHRLKNRESQLYMKLIDFDAPSRLLITGTPVQNNLTELSALMNFIMPGEINVDEEIDLDSEEASMRVNQLNAQIKPYMLRRTKKTVENDLPSKTEKIIRVELSDFQLEYYKNILTRNYAALNQGSRGQKASLLNIMMELKKASNHPFMFPAAEDRIAPPELSSEDRFRTSITSSGKMMLLDRLLTKLKQDGHRVLIFSQMVKMLDILAEYLRMRGHQYQRLDGTIAASQRRMSIDHFNAPDSNDYCFLLSTRAGGLGINLMTADTVILFDSDWNPQADLQAMARAHRIGQKKPVTVYRLVSKDTVEEEILERARNKLMLEYITIQRGVTDKEGTKEVADRMSRGGFNMDEPNNADDINRILKRRGQKMFEQNDNQKKLEEMDIDAVLENAEEHKTEQPEGIEADGGEEFLKSFEYTDVKIDLDWDEIIPKERLAKIKEEEEKRRNEEFLKAQIELNAPRKRKAAHEAHEQRAAKKRARQEAPPDTDDDDDDNVSDPGVDPRKPLDTREIRRLLKAYEWYGPIENRPEDFMKTAKLVGRDTNVVNSTLNDIIDGCQKVEQDELDRQQKIIEDEKRSITKKDQQKTTFSYLGLKLNSKLYAERAEDIRALKKEVEATSEWTSFRVPEATKPAEYTVEWGPREDAMLCVGMLRHGAANWFAIEADPDLGLRDKMFLTQHRVEEKAKRSEEGQKQSSPTQIHLLRRTAYLFDVLKDKASGGKNISARRALENHHRNNKKIGSIPRNDIRVDKNSRYSSPATNGAKRTQQDGDKPRPRKMEKSKASKSNDRLTPDVHGQARSKSHDHPKSELSNGATNGASTVRRQASVEIENGRSSDHHKTGSNSKSPNEHSRIERLSLDDTKDRPSSSTSRDQEHGRFSKESGVKKEHGSPSAHKHGHSHERSDSQRDGHAIKEVDRSMERFFEPVQKALDGLRGSRKLDNTAKVAAMKSTLTTLYKFIHEKVSTQSTDRQARCWDYVATYWPKKNSVGGPEVEKIAKRLGGAAVANGSNATQANGDPVRQGET